MQGHDGELIHFHGETRFALGDVWGATHFLLSLRQDLRTLETEPPDTTADDVVSTLHSAEGIESGWIVEWLGGRPVHER